MVFLSFNSHRHGPLPSPTEPESGGTTEDPIDAQLVEGILRNDREAWGALYTRHQSRVFAVCFQMVHDRELASDLTHDTFVKVIKGIASFDGRARFTTWMTRIAMNVCLSKIRSEKLRRHASLDAPTKDREHGRGPDLEQNREHSHTTSVEASEQKERVLAALRKLDPDQRAVLILADAQGLSYESIAATLQVAVGTVKSRLFRARAALKDKMELLDKPDYSQTP